MVTAEKAKALVAKRVTITMDSGDVTIGILYEVYLDKYVLLSNAERLFDLEKMASLEEGMK